MDKKEPRKISKEEWQKIVSNSDSHSKKFYELFEIKCKKCRSKDVEMFGEYDDSGCYYSGETGSVVVIIKCHTCGNAKVFKEPISWFDREVLE